MIPPIHTYTPEGKSPLVSERGEPSLKGRAKVLALRDADYLQFIPTASIHSSFSGRNVTVQTQQKSSANQE